MEKLYKGLNRKRPRHAAEFQTYVRAACGPPNLVKKETIIIKLGPLIREDRERHTGCQDRRPPKASFLRSRKGTE